MGVLKRKSHARNDLLQALFDRAQQAQIEAEIIDPCEPDPLPSPWLTADREVITKSLTTTPIDALMEHLQDLAWYTRPVNKVAKRKEERLNGAEFWASLPEGLNPATAKADLKKPGRAARKRAQMFSLVLLCLRCIRDGDIVVDFGAGSGHLGLCIAYLRPTCTVILVEPCEYHAQEQAKGRIAELGLINCSLYAAGVEEFAAANVDFDVGISLHSCGTITDKALSLCLARRAAFCLCPCCYGEVARTGLLPRSKAWAASFDQSDFLTLASAADTVAVRKPADWDTFASSDSFARAKRCMRIVDADRLQYAAEMGNYRTLITSLQPLNCSPKNNVIIGTPTAGSVRRGDIPLPVDKNTPQHLRGSQA